MEIEYSLLENGFDFLINAVNHMNWAKEVCCFDGDNKKTRLLKYSILHLSSGIELIFKYTLLKENWTYIFADMNKANKQAFNEGDFKTVDSSNNVDRLKNLCNVSFSGDDEKTLAILRKKRNKIEHFKFKDSTEAIESIMYDSLSVALNFIANYIDLNSLSANERELFDDIKKYTKDLGEVIAAREKIIEASAKNDGIYEQLLCCPECLKEYLYVDDGEVKCLFCDYSDIPEKVADAYISNVLNISSYICAKEGGEYPLYECVECGENSMVIDIDNNSAFCFNCGYKDSLANIHSCSECGKPYYSNGDEDITICHDCLDYKINNND